MALVDSLLRMLVQHEGDTAVLRLGEAPLLTRGEEPLRLFFPTFTEALRAQLLGDLLTAERLGALAQGQEVRFTYAPAGLSPFQVSLQGPGCERARFEREVPGGERRAHDAPPAAEQAIADALARARTTRQVTPPPPPRPSDTLSAPTVQVDATLMGLLGHAVRRGASDLHLAHGEPPVLRVDGRLSPLGRDAIDAHALLAQLDGDPLAALADGRGADTSFDLDPRTRVRAHVYGTQRGPAAAFRFVRRRPPTLEALGLPIDLAPLVAHPHGLVLLTGPSGSGKSTTLAALAQHALDHQRGLLVTLEDPIEVALEADGLGSLVRQRQVGRDVVDFPTGLRDALREDPDLLLIGELRDAESIQLALTAAETGHLVLASLHSRSAATAVDRVVDACPPERQQQVRAQLAHALRAVVSQRLLPRREGDGRVVAIEVMTGTTGTAALIREGRTAQLGSAILSGAADGMVPLERSLRDLVREGRVHARDARAACNDPATLEQLLRG